MVQRAKRISVKISYILSVIFAAFLAFFGKGPAAQATGTATQAPSGATRPSGALMDEQKPTTQAVDQQQRPAGALMDEQRPSTQAVDKQAPSPQAPGTQKLPH
ncbi:MAG: hypothetical protein IT573_10530 [Deltaproteobacteria bacterium]|nr:hypothetical protein [Deltaproteobacteria bacterium]